MREDLGSLLRDATLTTLAFAIAAGWSLYQVAHGVGVFVDALSTHVSERDSFSFSSSAGGGLTWIVGHHIVSLDGIVVGLIELALVLTVAALVRRR